MKVLSIQQPFASLVVLGHKKIETRGFRTKHRGELLIHSSAGMKSEYEHLGTHDERFTNCLFPKRYHQLHFGAIIGKVNLVDVIAFDAVRRMIEENMSITVGGNQVDFSEKELAFGDYSEGRYGWLLSDPVLFSNPIPAKGKLGIWDYEIEDNVELPSYCCPKCTHPFHMHDENSNTCPAY